MHHWAHNSQETQPYLSSKRNTSGNSDDEHIEWVSRDLFLSESRQKAWEKVISLMNYILLNDGSGMGCCYHPRTNYWEIYYIVNTVVLNVFNICLSHVLSWVIGPCQKFSLNIKFYDLLNGSMELVFQKDSKIGLGKFLQFSPYFYEILIIFLYIYTSNGFWSTKFAYRN